MPVDAPRIPDPAAVPDVGGETPVPPRAGRNLPAAIGVGLTLVAIICVPLFAARGVFGVVVVPAAVAVGLVELCRALRSGGLAPPTVPVAAGGALTVAVAYLREARGSGLEGGAEALLLGLVATVLVTLAWRAADGGERIVRDWSAAVFALVWVALLAGFAALLAAPDDGAQRVVCFIAVVVASDIGGYGAGVFLGRHPMAPSVSPKKSWEGFGGSVVACVIVGVVLLAWLLDAAWWQGVVYGLVVAGTATLGDLGESLVKRDLGIKDMGHLLPGHGGLMDRLDSLLVTAPVSWLLLAAFAPLP
jgi:phosphatidate cytidylyltransferase